MESTVNLETFFEMIGYLSFFALGTLSLMGGVARFGVFAKFPALW